MCATGRIVALEKIQDPEQQRSDGGVATRKQNKIKFLRFWIGVFPELCWSGWNHEKKTWKL